MQDSSARKERGYHRLEIYKLSHSLAIRVHKMTMALPRFETHEEGSQVRRSAKSVPSNIVEGFVLRKYKSEFLHYLYRAQASSEETVEHLTILFDTGSMKDEALFKELIQSYTQLSAMLFQFIRGVEERHDQPMYLKEDLGDYLPSNNNMNPESRRVPTGRRRVFDLNLESDSNLGHLR